MSMTKAPAAAEKHRDLRLDLFRGLANWAIFLDHIPNNAVAWITVKNYGFSDAAELFVFVSGYTVAFVYSRILRVQGFVAGSVALLGRAWQIYVAHILLFVFYVVAIGYTAQRYGHAHLLDEFNIRHLIAQPVEFLKHGLLLQFKPLNLDVLPLYIALMASFPPVLWMLVRFPNGVLVASLALYILARFLGWNLSGYPDGVWYFNPFAWQFLFVIGAWVATGGISRLNWLLDSATALTVASLFLLFAAVLSVTMRAGVDVWLPGELRDLFLPSDKTNLAPYRIVHFLALALVVSRLIPRNSPVLAWPAWEPVLICGRRSLEVFCAGVFLAFIAHFLIELVSTSLGFQIVVSVGGLALMTAVGYLRTWSKALRKNSTIVSAAARRSATAAIAGFGLFLAVSLGGGVAWARASMATENPWAPEHVRALPPDIQWEVVQRAQACGDRPAAQHYFSVSIEAEGLRFLSLHFEDFACTNRTSLCNGGGCLHQVYLKTGSRHRLIFSARAREVKLTNEDGVAGMEVSMGTFRKLYRWNGRSFFPIGTMRTGF